MKNNKKIETTGYKTKREAKDRPKGVKSAAVQAFLKRKEEEEKKKSMNIYVIKI